MAELTGQGGELRATIRVTRKATGKVEEYTLTGRCSPEQFQRIERAMGRTHDAAGAMTGPGSNITTTKE